MVKRRSTIILPAVLMLGLLLIGCEMNADDESGRIVPQVRTTLMEGTNPHEDSVHITWYRARDAEHFELAYRTFMDSSETRIPVSSWVTNTTFTHTGFVRNRGPLTHYVRAHGTRTNADGRTVSWVGPWAMSNLVEVRE